MQIDDSDGQRMKVQPSMRAIFETGSKTTVARFGQQAKQCSDIERREEGMQMEDSAENAKHHLPRVSTDLGMQISERPRQYAKAYSSIRESLVPDAKVTVESWPQSAKQFRFKILTEAGMQMDERAENLAKKWSSMPESIESDSNATKESVSAR
jgi:hypothetical protein